MHNNVMNMLKNFDFVTDMAIESAQSTGHLTNCDAKPLSYGIVKRTLRVKTIEDAKKKISNASEIFETGSFEEKSAIIHYLIDQIFVYDDHLEIHWNFE